MTTGESSVVEQLKAQVALDEDRLLGRAAAMTTLEAECVFRLMLHLDGAHIQPATVLAQDCEFLLSRASSSLRVQHNVNVMRVLETLALVVTDS